MNNEEKKEYEELKSLLYTGTISQYGKRKLIEIIEKQAKEIEKEKEKNIYLTQELEAEHAFYVSKDKIRDLLEAIKWKRNQELEDIGISMLGSAIDVLNKLLEE